MALRNQNAAILVCTTMCLNVSAGESIHIVKKGETLSNILYDLNLKPIYGNHGTLKETLSLNPKINNRKNYKIYPGEKVKLAIVNMENKIQLTEQNRTLINHETVLGESQTSKESPPTLDENKIINKDRAPSKLDDEQYSYFRLSPQISWLKFTATGSSQFNSSNITAITKANPGMLGVFGLNISDKYNLYGFGYVSQVNFYQDDRYSITTKSFFRQAYGLGTEYRIDEKNRLSLRAGFFDEFFLTTPDISTIKVESAQIPEVHWGYRKQLGQYKNFILDSGIFGKFILPYNTGSVNGKFGYGIGGDVMAILNSKGLRFFYNYSNAKAAGKTTTTLELGWNIVFEGKFYE